MLHLPPFCRPLTLFLFLSLHVLLLACAFPFAHFHPPHPITVLPALYVSLSRALILFPLHALGGL